MLGKNDAAEASAMTDTQHMKAALWRFYGNVFPMGDYFRWLSYGGVNKHLMAHREFSFTLANDVYIRFQSFETARLLTEELRRLSPVKIDIGAVYNVSPRTRKSQTAFVPVEKELVIDIDMTDYDEIRTCCQGGDVCPKCWRYMSLALRILDTALRDDFGFEHRLWVYSGRRGIHCWVCDRAARKLRPEHRRALMAYLELIRGGEHMAKKVNLGTHVHPAARRAYDIIAPAFDDLVADQGYLATPAGRQRLLELLPRISERDELRARLDEEDPAGSSLHFWRVVRAFADLKKNAKVVRPLQEYVLQHAYPRLDVNVSIGINHLLKSPFCVHPKTGRVCVPLDPATCAEFNPLECPTLDQVVAEHAAAVAAGTPYNVQSGVLGPAVEHFGRFVDAVVAHEQQLGPEATAPDFTF